MAHVQTCDICDAPGARTVTAALSVLGLVVPGQLTGGTLTGDACDAHFARVAGVLHEHIVDHLTEQGAHHGAVAAADAEIHAETQALAEFEEGPLRREYLRCREEADADHAAAMVNHAALNPGLEPPKRRSLDSFMAPEVRAAWQARVDALRAAVDKQRAALAAGTAACDEKHRAVARTLKARA